MADKINNLINSVQLDAAGMIAASKEAGAAARDLAAATDAAGAAVTRTDQALKQRTTSLEAIKRAADPVYKATQDQEKAERTLAAGLATGNATAEEAAKIREYLAAKTQAAADASKKGTVAATDHAKATKDLGTAAKLSYTDVEILRSGIINTVQSLGAGISATTTLQTQLLQTAPAFPGLARAMGPAILAIGATVLGVGALVAGFGILAAHAIDTSGAARTFGIAIRSMGADAETTVGQLNKLVEAMRDQGVSKDTARSTVASLVRTPTLSASGASQIASLSANFAAGSGQDVPTAAKALADGLSGGLSAALKLADAYKLLDAADKAVVAGLYETGKAGQGAQMILDAVAKRFENMARDAMSPMGRALNDIGRSWSDFVEKVSSSDKVLSFFNGLAFVMERVAAGAAALHGNGDSTGHGGDASVKILALTDELNTAQGVVDTMRANRELSGAPAASTARGAKEAQDRVDSLRTQVNALIAQAEAESEKLKAPIAGAGAPGAAAGPSPLASPIDTSGNVSYLQQIAKDAKRRQALIGAGATARALGEADIAAEAEGRTRNLEGDDLAALKATKRKEALIPLQDAIAKTSALSRIDASETVKVAAAYLISQTAGEEAERQRTAAAEHYTTGADKERRATELRTAAIDAAIVSGSQAIGTLREQRDASFAALTAETAGADAVRENTVQAKVNAETLKERVALVGATAEQETALNAIIATKTALIRDSLESDRQAYVIQQNRTAADAIEIDQLTAQSSAIADVNERKTAELAIDRKRQEIALRNDPRFTAEDRAGLITAGDTARSLQEVTRYNNDVRKEAEALSGSVSQFIVDGFVSAEKGGASSFKTIFDGALAAGKRFIVQLAANFAEKQLLIPIATALVGSAPGAFGIASASGKASGVGAGDILSLGKSFMPDLGINTAIDSFGAWSGLGGSAATAGAVTEAVGPAALGAVPGMVGGEAAGAASGLLTGAAGLSAAVPYIGAAVAGIALISSFMGGKKPTVGPGGGILFGVDETGAAVVGGGSGDNGYDYKKQGNLDAANTIGAAAKKFVESVGGTFGGSHANNNLGGDFGYDAGAKKFTGGDTTNGKGRYDTQDEAMAATLVQIIKQSVVTGISEDIKARIAAVSTSQDLANLLSYIAQLHSVVDTWNGWKEPLSQVAVSMATLQTSFDAAKSAATSLSIATDTLQTSYDAQKAYLVKQFNTPLQDRYTTAIQGSGAAAIVAKEREYAQLRKDAALLGQDAVLQVERTIAAERAAAAVATAQATVDGLQKTYDGLLTEMRTGLTATRDAWATIVTGLKTFRDSLLVGSLSPLSPYAQMMEAQKQLAKAVTAAKGGDLTAAGQVQGLAQTALQQTQSYYASGTDYAAYFQAVQDQLSGLADSAGAQQSAADRQLSAMLGTQSNTRTIADIAADIAATLKALNAAQVAVSTAATGGNATAGAAITAAYKTSLGYAPTSAQALATGDFLTSGHTLAETVATVTQSGEALTRAAYEKALGRAPEASVMQFWQSALDAPGADRSAILASLNGALVGSSEYKAKIPGFADGGDHAGGLRMVGENGWEVEATGPAKIWNQAQMKAAVGNDNSQVVAAVDRVSQKIDALLRVSAAAGGENTQGLVAVKSAVAELTRQVKQAS